MRVIAFRHNPSEGIGSISGLLERHHIGCDCLDLYARAAPLPDLADLADAAGLIFMGGPMSVNDDLPWVPFEIRAIRDAIDRGKPVLGICLGAQLIAKTLGARVYRNPVKEIGWAPVHWTEQAAADPLFRGFSNPETLFHWHGETFDLPKGARHLAYSETCRNQAFGVASNIYGLQFHLEVTPAIIQEWCRIDEQCGSAREIVAPIDPHVNSARLAGIAEQVFDRWCALLS